MKMPNLREMIDYQELGGGELFGGGPGSGCHGENCGRPSGSGSGTVQDRGVGKDKGALQPDNSKPGMFDKRGLKVARALGPVGSRITSEHRALVREHEKGFPWNKGYMIPKSKDQWNERVDEMRRQLAGDPGNTLGKTEALSNKVEDHSDVFIEKLGRRLDEASDRASQMSREDAAKFAAKESKAVVSKANSALDKAEKAFKEHPEILDAISKSRKELNKASSTATSVKGLVKLTSRVANIGVRIDQASDKSLARLRGK